MQNPPNRGLQRTAERVEGHFAGVWFNPHARFAWLTLSGSTWREASAGVFVHCTITRHPVTVMLPFIISFLNRKRGFAWSPAVDLSDPYVAAALAPMTHS